MVVMLAMALVHRALLRQLTVQLQLLHHLRSAQTWMMIFRSREYLIHKCKEFIFNSQIYLAFLFFYGVKSVKYFLCFFNK
jgi:hypothetical protein